MMATENPTLPNDKMLLNAIVNFKGESHQYWNMISSLASILFLKTYFNSTGAYVEIQGHWQTMLICVVSHFCY